MNCILLTALLRDYNRDNTVKAVERKIKADPTTLYREICCFTKAFIAEIKVTTWKQAALLFSESNFVHDKVLLCYAILCIKKDFNFEEYIIFNNFKELSKQIEIVCKQQEKNVIDFLCRSILSTPSFFE